MSGTGPGGGRKRARADKESDACLLALRELEELRTRLLTYAETITYSLQVTCEMHASIVRVHAENAAQIHQKKSEQHSLQALRDSVQESTPTSRRRERARATVTWQGSAARWAVLAKRRRLRLRHCSGCEG